MTDDLVFAPAKPGNEAWLIALLGPSSAGKTYSALRLARGIAGPNGRIGFADTENRRGLFYAREFSFDHATVNPPFRPDRYVLAVEKSKAAGHSVLIIDSMSHEQSGTGGLLEMHEAELDRMTARVEEHEKYAARERMKLAAWIKPKMAHKAMMARLLQLNVHVIFCLRAEKKTEMVKNKKGKLEVVDAGWRAVAERDFMYDMTCSLLLLPDAPGKPQPLKVQRQHWNLFTPGAVLDEATGARIAAYARGETVEAPGQPGGDESPPGAPESPPGDRLEASSMELIDRFERTQSRREHFALTEHAAVQRRMQRLKDEAPELFVRVNDALTESFKRTAGTEGDGPPSDEPPPDEEQAA